MNLRIVGSIMGSSGYDSHCRQLFNALTKYKELDIKLDVPLPQDFMRQVNDEEYKAITKKERVEDVTIGVMTPPYYRLALSDNTKKFIGYCIFEGNKIPKYWLDYLLDERVDQIWVPSTNTKQAIWNTYWDGDYIFGDETAMNDADRKFWDKVKIIPHGVDLSIFKPTECKRDNKFTFVCNKGFRGNNWDRGGVQYLIKAFMEEFTKEENVQLLLKLNPAYINPQILDNYMKSLNLPQNHPDIKVLTDNIPFNKLPEVYCMGDVFVCTTRGESFNLPGLEAMACGLPTIQTKDCGMDYMTDKNSLFVEAIEEDVTQDIMYEEVKWKTPIIEDIKKKLRYAYEHQEEMKEKGKQALEDSKLWTWEKSTEMVMTNLKSL